MKVKPTLFFDFDEMLMVTRQVTLNFIVEYYGVQIPEEIYLCGNSLWQLINSYLPPDKQISREQFYEDWSQKFLTSHEAHAKAIPVLGAEKQVPRLARRYTLWIVTARQEAGQPVVAKLSQKFFGQHISGMHFVWKRHGQYDFRVNQSKKDFIAGFPGLKIAFFDDNPGEVREVQTVIPTYLFDPPDRHGGEVNIKRRIRSWEEIADLML